MKRKVKKSEHILTFIKRLQDFSQREGITSDLKLDKDKTVEDVFQSTEVGGIIADIDNGVGELIDVLHEYYKFTGNTRLLKRLNKLK